MSAKPAGAIGAIEVLSFVAKLEPIDRLCRRIITDAGGVAAPEIRSVADIPRGFTWRNGYLLPGGPVAERSEADYAFRILFLIGIANRAPDRDTALKACWDAAALTMEAMILFPQRKRARAASWAAAAKRTSDRGHEWHREVEARKPALTKASVYAHIERREGLRPGTVKKAIQRHTRKK